jgi:RNA polymerase sigma factor (sigma-70 family)
MREKAIHAAVRHLRGLVADAQDNATSDPELLQRFTDGRDEAAFAALVRRHGPMVREVCRRLLSQVSDVDDASQVVFLVLACKAGSIRRRQSLAGWLYGIAYRTALPLRRDAARRKGREGRETARTPSDPAREAIHRELCAVIDAELFHLPEDQRAALVLCYLEGRTRDEAARQLGQSVRTLDRLLQRGRQLLRLRLTRRGVTLSAALLSLGMSQDLARAGAAAGIRMGRKTAAQEVSAEVIALMKGVLRSMFWTRSKIIAASLLAFVVMGTATGLLAFRATAKDSAAQRQSSPRVAPRKATPEPDVYALILIEDGEPRLLPDVRHVAPAEGDPSVFRRTQAVLLRGRSTLRSALKRDEVKRLAIHKGKADPEGWLARNIETTLLDNTGVLRVSLGEGSPEERAALINAVVAAYMDDVVYAEQRAKESRVADLDKALSISAENLRRKRETVHALSKHLGTGSLSFQRQSALEELASLRKELLRVRLDKVGTVARLDHLKRTGRKNSEAFARLQEEEIVLSEQEKLLEKDIFSLKAQAERIAKDEERASADQRSLQEEIAADEQIHKQLAGRIRTSQVE